jgi:hypothetical protein
VLDKPPAGSDDELMESLSTTCVVAGAERPPREMVAGDSVVPRFAAGGATLK